MIYQLIDWKNQDKKPSAKKVELNKVKDLKSALSETERLGTDMVDFIMELRVAADELRDAGEKAQKHADKTGQAVNDLERLAVVVKDAAEELGIEVPEVDKAMDLIQDIDYGLNELDEMIAFAKRI